MRRSSHHFRLQLARDRIALDRHPLNVRDAETVARRRRERLLGRRRVFAHEPRHVAHEIVRDRPAAPRELLEREVEARHQFALVRAHAVAELLDIKDRHPVRGVFPPAHEQAHPFALGRRVHRGLPHAMKRIADRLRRALDHGGRVGQLRDRRHDRTQRVEKAWVIGCFREVDVR